MMEAGKKNPIHMITFILLVIGGLNWLLVAFGYNLVDSIFGEGSMIAKVIYILVGVSAVYEAVMHKGYCKQCEMMMKKGDAMTGGSMSSGQSSGPKM